MRPSQIAVAALTLIVLLPAILTAGLTWLMVRKYEVEVDSESLNGVDGMHLER